MSLWHLGSFGIIPKHCRPVFAVPCMTTDLPSEMFPLTVVESVLVMSKFVFEFSSFLLWMSTFCLELFVTLVVVDEWPPPPIFC